MSTAARAAGVPAVREAASRQSSGSVRASRPTSQARPSVARAARHASSVSPVTCSPGEAAPSPTRPPSPSIRTITLPTLGDRILAGDGVGPREGEVLDGARRPGRSSRLALARDELPDHRHERLDALLEGPDDGDAEAPAQPLLLGAQGLGRACLRRSTSRRACARRACGSARSRRRPAESGGRTPRAPRSASAPGACWRMTPVARPERMNSEPHGAGRIAQRRLALEQDQLGPGRLPAGDDRVLELARDEVVRDRVEDEPEGRALHPAGLAGEDRARSRIPAARQASSRKRAVVRLPSAQSVPSTAMRGAPTVRIRPLQKCSSVRRRGPAHVADRHALAFGRGRAARGRRRGTRAGR